ncbi:transcriptional activator of glycolytic enzymes-domain-containing protein [Mucor lusitanicus]
MPRQTLKNKTQAEVDIIVAHENHCDELVKYIPHFLDIWRNNKRRLQQSENGAPVETVSDTDVPTVVYKTAGFLNAEGTYDAALQEEHDRQMQSQAYSDIIKNRSYNTTVTYGYRQIEFLLFCEKYYASMPLADRFQANEKTLLAFMMREVNALLTMTLNLKIPQATAKKKTMLQKVNSHVAANVIPQSVILTELAPEVQQEITALDEQHSSVNSRLDATDNGVQQPLQLSVTLNGNLATSSNPSTNNIPSTSTATTSTATTSNIPIPAATTSSASNPRRFQANGAPDFKMSRGLTTVEQLHQEWYTGLGGDWPVAELEATWGTQWRLNDRKFVNIRRCVISAISDLENDLGLSTTAAIEQLQDVMARNNWSLHKLGVQLQNGNFYPCEVTKRRKLNQ